MNKREREREIVKAIWLILLRIFVDAFQIKTNQTKI